MGALGDELVGHTAEIVQKWFEAWKRSSHPHPEIQRAALEDHLALQLRTIGEQLDDLDRAEDPDSMWRTGQRIDPEARVHQDVPIEEVVEEYRIAVGVVRAWIEERQLDVGFAELSYFFEAMFALTAESVRRYSEHEADLVARARGDYLAGIAHQLRNPIQVISLQLKMLERSARPSSAETVAALQRSLGRLKSLVDGVMRLERFKPEELPVKPRHVRVAEFVDQVFSDNEYDAVHKGLRLEVATDRSLEMDVDPDLLLDALGNLVQNAVKYTSRGFVRIATRETPAQILFEVCDSGPGISLERQNDLFKLVSPSKPGGVGIGLVVAARGVQAQEGTIGIQSEPGKGSRFWFRLPKSVRPREAPRAAA
jgi:signal transduction histidine kinase